MITSRFPINIATLPDLASDSSDCTSGPTALTDVTLPFHPPSLPLLYSPDPFPTESRLSQVQCSVSLVVPEFWTLSPFDHLPFPTFGYRSPSVFTFVPLSYSLFPFTALPSHSNSCSTYSSSQYFAHFPCSLFGLPYVGLAFYVPFPHVSLGLWSLAILYLYCDCSSYSPRSAAGQFPRSCPQSSSFLSLSCASRLISSCSHLALVLILFVKPRWLLLVSCSQLSPLVPYRFATLHSVSLSH